MFPPSGKIENIPTITSVKTRIHTLELGGEIFISGRACAWLSLSNGKAFPK